MRGGVKNALFARIIMIIIITILSQGIHSKSDIQWSTDKKLHSARQIGKNYCGQRKYTIVPSDKQPVFF
jgi:hypothetical protein